MKFLNGLSKPTLIGLLVDLLTIYFNDKNSSKLRELVAVYLAGYEPLQEKLGYNGYRQVADTGKVEYCEVKPKNTQKKKDKLDGGGSFNDYTPERLEEDIRNNPTVLACGYVNGKLLYIIAFTFECIKSKMENLLKRRFGEEMRRRRGEYLRSASFSFRDYRDCRTLKVVYAYENIEDYREYIAKDLYKFLEKHLSQS
ncbi:MAG: hypothetical protein RMK75_03640 [Aquificaceae bacterium]|nr:hypothetical protein [Aquificaceae bacterium]MDW8423398.1 hypothetical protein [Aquificaceae bacterium]